MQAHRDPSCRLAIRRELAVLGVTESVGFPDLCRPTRARRVSTRGFATRSAIFVRRFGAAGFSDVNAPADAAVPLKA